MIRQGNVKAPLPFVERAEQIIAAIERVLGARVRMPSGLASTIYPLG